MRFRRPVIDSRLYYVWIEELSALPLYGVWLVPLCAHCVGTNALLCESAVLGESGFCVYRDADEMVFIYPS